MIRPHCSHGIAWAEECCACSIVWHRERLAEAERKAAEHRAMLAQLEPAAPLTTIERADVLRQARDLLRACRIYATSRQALRQPWEIALYDETIRVLDDAIANAQPRPARRSCLS